MKSDLNSPYRFERAGKTSKNRVVLAALTNKQSQKDGTLSDQEINWLRMRAEGGFGIITTAATNVSKDGQGWEGELGIYDDKHISGFSRLADQIHKENSLLLAQIFHGGARAPQEITGTTPVSATRYPSDVSESGYTRALSGKEIKRIINDFASAAKRCFDAGLDGVELHGAHGYLISQFLGKKSNQRTDEWGGSFQNRLKFLIEIYHSIRERVDDNFIVGIRLSPEIASLGIEINESIELVQILKEEMMDFIHFSVWDYKARSRQYPDDPRSLTQWFTENIDNLPPVISTGAVWSRNDADTLLDQGADFIGLGRAAIVHPDWAMHFDELDYNPFKPPVSREHLAKAGLSSVFIEYMTRWENFVL